jgi:hypothetical protein
MSAHTNAIVTCIGYGPWLVNGTVHHRVADVVYYPNPHSRDAEWRLWLHCGRLHRMDGPALIKSVKGRVIAQLWYQWGVLHRADGPAIEEADGLTMVYLGGEEQLWALPYSLMRVPGALEAIVAPVPSVSDEHVAINEQRDRASRFLKEAWYRIGEADRSAIAAEAMSSEDPAVRRWGLLLMPSLRRAG